MRIAVTGSSGFIGSAVCARLAQAGHSILHLVRDRAKVTGPDFIFWNPDSGEIDARALENADAVVHLAGESIADGRWTPERKQRIMESRRGGTRLLCQTLANLTKRPATLVSASAIGYYGDRGSEKLTEQSSAGSGFLADVCKEWELATQAAKDAGMRVVSLRIGVVLGQGGGAMAKMLPLFRTGLGGPLGSGQQYWSWVSLEELTRIVEFAVSAGQLQGPVNCVSPDPVTNKQFTAELAGLLHRPAFLPAPDFALKVALGEMADEMLLSSQRVYPAALESAGYRFVHPRLTDGLSAVLNS